MNKRLVKKISDLAKEYGYTEILEKDFSKYMEDEDEVKTIKFLQILKIRIKIHGFQYMNLMEIKLSPIISGVVHQELGIH